MDNLLDIREIIKNCNDDTILLTAHSKNRCVERGIKFEDIKNAIQTGEIIEQYEDDKPFPSCLIFGYSENNKVLHVVLSMDGNYIYVITAYFPNLIKWNEDFKTRRR